MVLRPPASANRRGICRLILILVPQAARRRPAERLVAAESMLGISIGDFLSVCQQMCQDWSAKLESKLLRVARIYV